MLSQARILNLVSGQGYAAGNALPSPMKNVQKNFLQKYWARWKADHSGRRSGQVTLFELPCSFACKGRQHDQPLKLLYSRAMPHIKTFVRYREQSIT